LVLHCTQVICPLTFHRVQTEVAWTWTLGSLVTIYIYIYIWGLLKLSCTINPSTFSSHTQDAFIKRQGIETINCITQTLEPSLVLGGPFYWLRVVRVLISMLCTWVIIISCSPKKTNNKELQPCHTIYFWSRDKIMLANGAHHQGAAWAGICTNLSHYTCSSSNLHLLIGRNIGRCLLAKWK
jgi:hypothetical protein